MRHLVCVLAVLVACALSACSQIKQLCPKLCPSTPTCCADCNGDRTVTVDELVRQSRIYQQLSPLSECPAADCEGNGKVDLADLAAGNEAAQAGCPR